MIAAKAPNESAQGQLMRKMHGRGIDVQPDLAHFAEIRQATTLLFFSL